MCHYHRRCSNLHFGRLPPSINLGGDAIMAPTWYRSPPSELVPFGRDMLDKVSL